MRKKTEKKEKGTNKTKEVIYTIDSLTMTDFNILFILYKNAINLIEFRGKGPLNENTVRLQNMEEFIDYFTKKDYRVVVRGDGLQVIIIGPHSQYLKANGIQSMFTNIVTTNTIFIVPSESEYGSLVTYIQRRRRLEYTKKNLDPDTAVMTADTLFKPSDTFAYTIEMNTYESLAFNMPTSFSFTRYRLYSEADVKEWCNTTKRKTTLLPRISTVDKSLFWYGFMNGSVVEEVIQSPTAGETCRLKLVVNSIPIKAPRQKAQKNEI